MAKFRKIRDGPRKIEEHEEDEPAEIENEEVVADSGVQKQTNGKKTAKVQAKNVKGQTNNAKEQAKTTKEQTNNAKGQTTNAKEQTNNAK